MREKQVLPRAIEIQKENWGKSRIFQRYLSNNISKKRQNIKQCMAFYPKLKLNYL